LPCPARSDAEAEALFSANIKLAYAAAAKFWKWPAVRRTLEHDDLIQLTLTSLWLACLSWDQSRGALSTLAWLSCKHRVMNAIARRRCHVEVPASQLPPTPDGLSQVEAAPARAEADAGPRLDIDAALAALHGVDGEVLRLRYLSGGSTLAEVGEALGVSGERVRQREARAIKLLRKSLA
jgi:RNA polymerase sigma factor (sigma-70 family)